MALNTLYVCQNIINGGWGRDRNQKSKKTTDICKAMFRKTVFLENTVAWWLRC